jgi:NADH-quinone oxidoreductase subunit D
MEEMLESLKLVEQVIENFPEGPVNVDPVTKAVIPAKPAVYRSIEGLIQHFEVIMPNRGFGSPHEEVYAAIESPNGELGFYIAGDGSSRAYRARCRPPSYVHFSIFPHCIKDHQLSDVVAVLGSLNIIAAELDR